uniref:Uncharacterized protein n=1 Tax=Romanomermis culicivorax TaxID=13658 RepID=A0A915JHF2_ROMCU
MEMDKKAEMKKKKGSITLTKGAISPKYQMKPVLIIATTTMMQPQSLKSHLQAVWAKFSNKRSNSIHEKWTVKAPSMINGKYFLKTIKI